LAAAWPWSAPARMKLIGSGRRCCCSGPARAPPFRLDEAIIVAVEAEIPHCAAAEQLIGLRARPRKTMLQMLALRLYRSRVAKAFIRSRIGDHIFPKLYFLYKHVYEARAVARLRPYINRDSWIVDVGANIGFFTVTFAGWLERGKVLALEPEPENFRRLQTIIAAGALDRRVEARQVAVAECQGLGHLILSQESHADHRLGETGLPVPLDTLDSIWSELGRPDIRLIKIDVQGAECRVLLGAEALLNACRPALYIEIDTDPGRVECGHPSALLAALDALGYQPHAWHGGWTPLALERALADARRGASRYADFLFIRK
jgi:FkbM family methyltransferase